MGKEISKVANTAVALRSERKGRYDYDVEIFRDGQMIPGLLSQVEPGDCFNAIHRGQMWFKCISPISMSTTGRSEDSLNNPTFSMAGIEVMQAPPTVDHIPKLVNPKKGLTANQLATLGGPQSSTGNGELPKASWDPDYDVIDMEFKEVPDVKRLT